MSTFEKLTNLAANKLKMEKNLQQVFENQRVAIVGDVMIDRYLTGSVTRISPEAPVPVVLHRATENRLGGAANVALNVAALGGIPILCSVVGADEEGRLFQNLLAEQGISAAGIAISGERTTTVKTRILGGTHQMLRIDHEDSHDLSAREEADFLQKLEATLAANRCSVLIFQDYNKGVLSANVIRAGIELAKRRGILTAVDPKRANFFEYRGVDLFKPNLKEVRDSLPFPVGRDLESLRAAANFVRSRLGNRFTMITLSENGLFLEDESSGQIFPTKTRNVADVSGAGDTVISVAAMALAAGLDLRTIAQLSNLAGGQVCESPGVVSVNRELLFRELEEALGAA